MPAKAALRVPLYRCRKPTGQAVVTLSGKDHYLGKWNTAAKRSRFVGATTCGKKPHLHPGIKYDKIPAKSPNTGELGLGLPGKSSLAHFGGHCGELA
jgi:hypothetical protein